ncbi:hypothetical protein ACVWW6_005763 [Bradyrhizobium sp. USDA 3311]|nr:hypothetical protein [Bradyrhizobium japonicum]
MRLSRCSKGVRHERKRNHPRSLLPKRSTSGLKDLREMVREDIEEQREFIRKIRKKMH